MYSNFLNFVPSDIRKNAEQNFGSSTIANSYFNLFMPLRRQCIKCLSHRILEPLKYRYRIANAAYQMRFKSVRCYITTRNGRPSFNVLTLVSLVRMANMQVT